MADLSQELGEEFEIRILAPAVPGSAAREKLSDRVEIIRYRFFPRRWEDLADGAILENVRSRPTRLLQVPFLLGGLARAIRRELRQFRPDAVHAHWIIPQGIVARRCVGTVPTVVTTLGGDLYALNSRFARALKSDVLRHAAAVTVMNEDMRARAIALGAAASTTSVMPMGARLSTAEHDGDVDTDRHDPAAPVTLLAVGRLVEKKGFDVLLHALREADFPYSLTIVGDGPERAALTALAEGLPVSFVGQLGRDALVQEYRSAAIAVFPSRRAASGDQDGLPVAMLEAMGAGCAVVATDLPGLNEAVQDGESGILVPEDDADALRRTLQRLATDVSTRERLGRAARRRARSYSISAVGERYRELFRSVIGTPARDAGHSRIGG